MYLYLALAALLFGGMAMRLVPLLRFEVWGSDWGEYYSITDHLVREGAMVEHHLGWGEAYPDFPGMFSVAGASALVLGVPTGDALSYVVPCATALSVLLVACIVLRVRRWPAAAIIAAAFLAVCFPEVFTNSHPVPGSLGAVITVAIVLVFLMGDAWRRDRGVDAQRPLAMYILMVVLVGGLTPLHHLSLYFAFIAVGLGHLMRAVLATGPERARRDWGEFSVLLLLGSAALFWVAFAPTFRAEIMVDFLGVPGVLVMVGTIAVTVVLLQLAERYARRGHGPPRLALSGGGTLRTYLVLFAVMGAVIVAAAGVWGVPGTTITPGLLILPFFLPMLLLLTLTAGASELLLRTHGGLVVVAWLGAVVASFLFASATSSGVLVSYRHLPYVIEAAAVLLGVGAVHFRRMALPEGRRASVAMGLVVCVLMVALVPTAYPPKEVMGGFQEGTDQREMAAVLWLREGLPAPGADPEDQSTGVLVSDHRLSSVAFGAGDTFAAWDFSTELLRGPLDEEALRQLADMDTPQNDRPVAAFLLSEDLREGAAGSQWSNAEPIEGEGWDKYWQDPFVRVYDGGTAWVMGVGPLPPG